MPGEHIDALGSFARILEATLCRSGKITRSTNRSVGCWLGKEAGKVGIRILIKLQSVSLTLFLKHIGTTCLFLPAKAQAALKSQSWWPCPQPLASCTIAQATGLHSQTGVLKTGLQKEISDLALGWKGLKRSKTILWKPIGKAGSDRGAGWYPASRDTNILP